ncbi:MAG TPA: hypothetical protein VGD92_03505 [Sphingobacteriaceae bacterium]
MHHTFHIPVLGLGFSIDTPLKVARYGIASVVSIVDDELIERMYKYHAGKHDRPYTEIGKHEPDHRARRITRYLNLLNELVNEQFEALRSGSFGEDGDLTRYFDLLPDQSLLKRRYLAMLAEEDPGQRAELQAELRRSLRRGAIDVNIMSKVDKINYRKDGTPLGEEFTDALASLRGFACSDLDSSVVLSAGMNPRLYSALEQYPDFFPGEDGTFRKKIMLKVSDFRSALIQAKFLAKKGLWVSEFRIESGLNCGGHAFATEGYLLGPVLEEFRSKRQELLLEMFTIYQHALRSRGTEIRATPDLRVTVQGGIGTAGEDHFLLNHYQLDGTGWGSPFLLVPEVTNVDAETLDDLASATPDDFYISGASPLGVPFNNFRKSGAEKQRLARIAAGRPGSPCTKKFLVSDTEFTDLPICTASREYQNLKIRQLDGLGLDEREYRKRFDEITEKTCLCVGLTTSAYLKNGMLKPRESKAVSICPGPNLAFFSGTHTLEEMVGHIYGRISLITSRRSHMFINELNLYIDYLKKDLGVSLAGFTEKKQKQLSRFRDQLLQGIRYYRDLLPDLAETFGSTEDLERDLFRGEVLLNALEIPVPEAARL